IRETHKAGMTVAVIYAVEGLASLNVNQNEPERAASLFSWADFMRDQVGDQRPPVEQASVEQDLAIIHSRLDDQTFEKVYNIGHSLTLEQAITLASEE